MAALDVHATRHLPAAVAELRAEAQHRLLHLPDVSSFHPHRHVVLGLLLDQSRSHFRARRSWYATRPSTDLLLIQFPPFSPAIRHHHRAHHDDN